MNNEKESKFTVVIRSAGERTKEACLHLVLQEVPEEDVHIIEKEPFEEALRETYRIGMNSKKEWLIALDADVLPRQGFTGEIAKITDSLKNRVFTFKPMIYDKLFFKHRMAGFRVYRTRYLEEALAIIPPNGVETRPESFAVAQMEKKKLKALVFEYVAGLHDFEQYYRDIYRKTYFHSYKHMHQLFMVIEDWKKESNRDSDYKVALKGALDGLMSLDEPLPDIRFFKKRSKNILKSINLIEKDELSLNSIENRVEEILQEAGPFLKKYRWASINKECNKRGLLPGLIYSFGTLLEIAGNKVKSVISRRA